MVATGGCARNLSEVGIINHGDDNAIRTAQAELAKRGRDIVASGKQAKPTPPNCSRRRKYAGISKQVRRAIFQGARGQKQSPKTNTIPGKTQTELNT